MSLANSSCSICLETVVHPIARLEPCSHQYCFSCVSGWLLEKNTCPYCTQLCTSIVKIENKLKTELSVSKLRTLFPASKKVESDDFVELKQETFAFIDHEYVASEVKVLLARASDQKRRLNSFANKSKPNRQDYLRCLENIVYSLEDLGYDMESFVEFDAKETMLMLYDINADLNVIDKNGDVRDLTYCYQDDEYCEDFDRKECLFDKITVKVSSKSTKKK
eukprot:TRINITY_DN2784_c0_g1_i3.p1 TRINITY_DN2784_c0_g1~~TRINITY_DN2784_c0_g1_i3.p1  ORF type:complete len:221 (-),score=46.88 TRINITY_DN2784_c0_g1_i3:165-827(-)